MERHDLDLLSLILGIAFCVLGLAFLGGHAAPFDLHLLRWAWPVLLIVAGVATLLTTRPRRGPGQRT